jgi:hypothetical protein
MKVWIKNNNPRVLMIEESRGSQSDFFVYYDLSEEDRQVDYILRIETGLQNKSVLLDSFHLADKSLEDFYLYVLRGVFQ